MRVLVTGASGLIGGGVARALLARGDDVTTLQRRASGVPGARDVLASLDGVGAPVLADALRGADAVVHCAAKVSFTGAESGFAAVNTRATASLLAAAREAGASRFVQVSSPSVAHAGSALVGAGADPADPQRARGPYARTKAAGELLALAADGPGLAVTAVRPHVVWGPGDPQLAERVIDRARAGRFPLVGDGAALIDSTYSDDAVSSLLAALDRLGDDGAAAVRGRAFVVSSGDPRTVGELLGRIARAGGAPEPVRRLPLGVARAAGGLAEGVWAVLRRAGSSVADDEPPLTRFLAEQLGTAHWFDQRTTRAALRWSPAVGVDEGLRRLAAHYGGTAP